MWTGKSAWSCKILTQQTTEFHVRERAWA